MNKQGKYRVILWVLGGFMMPPISWLLVNWYLKIWTVDETVQIILSPRMWAYIIVFVGTVFTILIKKITPICDYRQKNENISIDEAQKNTAFIPKFIIVSNAIYSLVGPIFVLFGKDFLSQREFILSSVLGFALIFLFTVPFFINLTITMEKLTSQLPLSNQHKFLS